MGSQTERGLRLSGVSDRAGSRTERAPPESAGAPGVPTSSVLREACTGVGTSASLLNADAPGRFPTRVPRAQDWKYYAKGPWACPAPSLRAPDGRSSPGVAIPHGRQVPWDPMAPTAPHCPHFGYERRPETPAASSSDQRREGAASHVAGGPGPRWPRLLRSHAQVGERGELGSYRKVARSSWKPDSKGDLAGKCELFPRSESP